MISNIKKRNQRGFTIVELMIATTVLSVVLLLVTAVMIGIGNLFYKGVNQARVQDNVRNISDEFAQQLKFSGSGSTPSTTIPISVGGFATTIQAKCIGSYRYSYVLGLQIGTNASSQIRHVLWRDQPGSCSAPADLRTPLTNGVELIAPGARLSNLAISTDSPYTIDVAVAYGEDDLFPNPHATNPSCLGNAGDQYCATASLTTTAVKRLTGE